MDVGLSELYNKTIGILIPSQGLSIILYGFLEELWNQILIEGVAE
jgi:hypothetical protein